MTTLEYTLRPDVVFTVLDQGESVLLKLDTKYYYSLNQTGTRIVQLLEEGLNRARIMATLEAEYDVAPEQLDRMLSRFFDHLLRDGIIDARS